MHLGWTFLVLPLLDVCSVTSSEQALLPQVMRRLRLQVQVRCAASRETPGNHAVRFILVAQHSFRFSSLLTHILYHRHHVKLQHSNTTSQHNVSNVSLHRVKCCCED